MKMTAKKLVSLFLALIMIFGAAPVGALADVDFKGLFEIKASAVSYNGTCGENLTWTLDTGTGELLISGTGDMWDWPDQSSVPWYSYRSEIKSVIIEDGITSVGEYAFYDSSNITDASIPDSVTKIGGYSFSFCFYLNSIDISDNVLSIGEFAFYYCESLKSVKIGTGITKIGIRAFELCKIETVNYAGTLEEWRNISIDSGNLGLTSNLICEIDPDSSFYDSGTFDKNFSWILYNNGELVVSGTGNMTNWSDSSKAPWYNHHLMIKSVTIEYGVTNIGDYAFHSYPDLESVTISDSVKTIGDYAFYDCDSLANLSIGSSVTWIGDYAFYACSNLTGVTIPDSVTRIGSYAFSGCIGLISVTIGNSVKTMGDYAFAGCKNLVSITLGKAFSSCGGHTFFACSSLKDVYYKGNLDEWCKLIFYYYYSNPMSYAENLYIDGKLLSGEVVIPDSVTRIGDYLFYNCDSITSVIFPESVTYIGRHGFEGCKKLTSVTINNSATRIGDYAFGSCSALAKVYYNGTQEQWNKMSIGINNAPLLNAEIIFTHEHEFTFDVTKQPTCTEDGLKTFTCGCGYSDTELIKADGHTTSEWEYIAGNEFAKSCTVCGEKLESKTVTINMHLNGEDVKDKQLLNKETAIATVTVTDNFTSDIVFVSSDDSIVSVDDKGILAANNIGSVTITVVIGGTEISDSIEIEVLPRDFTITWIVDGVETLQTVREYEEIVPIVNPNVESYVFKGWNCEVPETMPSNNLIFIAVLEKIAPIAVRIVKDPLKTEYIYMKEDIDISGIELEVIYSDGTSEIVTDTSEMTVSGFSNEKRGDQIVTLEYEGLKAEYKVTVKYTWWQWILVVVFFLWILK